MLKRNQVSTYFVKGCIKNFLLLPISVSIHKNPKNVLALEENVLAFSGKVVLEYKGRTSTF